ncbi:hypothetical protein QVD17_39667 [Tagetes erecta]|uniref:Uncharacterized protein n=1 Tax=Tagetes erecta TaxID=13708 RepID=A0AAD8JNY8_TARER|nr:hypothetical protein QVD17_39667 [Tagetes erecta]
MCGTLCCEYRDGRLHGILASTWKKCFKEKRLDHIINHGLERHMEPGSLNTFSTIAYQCLKTNLKERPTMAKIVEELKDALEQQEVFEDMGKKLNFEGMRRIADLLVSPLAYKTQSQLLLLFMKGLLIDNGKTWFSINNKGQHCEAIAVEKCISLDEKRLFTRGENLDSRFQYLLEYKSTQDLSLRIETQFLSLHVTYVINLVYKCQFPPQGCLRIPFRYKLAEMKAYATSCVAHEGERGWLRTELFQFTSTKNQHHFDIQFTSEMRSKEDHVLSYLFYIFIEAVEFRPVDFEENENKVAMQPTDVDNDWRERVPNDYNKIVEDVDKSMTTKEVYALLRRGIYINKSQQWFSISKKSEKRLMLPARAFLPKRKFHLSQRKTWLWKSLPGSRFMEVAECSDNNRLAISLQIDSYLLSSGIKYACYLVFKLPENASVFEGIVITNFTEWVGGNCIYLVTPPHTPVIVLSPDERPSRSRKIKGHPKLRKDGWMEVQVWQFYHRSGRVSFKMDGYLESLKGWNFTGLLVQGFEFRPAKVFSLNYFEGMYM